MGISNINAQCDLYELNHTFDCDDNNTPDNHLDDTYYVKISMFNYASSNNSDIKLNLIDTLFAVILHVNIENENLISDISTPLPDAEYSIKNGELHLIWIDQSEGKTGFKIDPNTSVLNISYRDNVNTVLNEGENLILTKAGIYQLTNEKLQLRNNSSQKTLEIDGKYINFDFEGKGENTLIDIFDMNGRRVFSENFDILSEFSILDYKCNMPGMYLINIKNIDNNIVKKLFVD